MIETETIASEDVQYIIQAPKRSCLKDAADILEERPLGDEFSGVELDFVVRACDGTERTITVKATEVDLPEEACSVELEASLHGYVGDVAVECVFEIGGAGLFEIVS